MRRWIAAALVALIAGFLIVVWIQRTSIAARALTGWCDTNGWTCTAELTRIDPTAVVARNLSIKTAEGQPVSAERIDLDLRWRWFFNPYISKVYAEKPQIRGRLSEDGVDLFGLETLLNADETSGGSGAPIPELQVRKGSVRLETPGGELSASVDVSGKPFMDGRVDITLPGQEFSDGDDVLSWPGGRLVLNFSDGETSGNIELEKGPVRLPGLAVESIELNINITDAGGAIKADGAFSATSISLNDIMLESAKAELKLESGRPEGVAFVSILAAVETLSLDIETESLAMASAGIGHTGVSLRLTSAAVLEEPYLAGAVCLMLHDVEGPVGAGAFALTGTGRVSQSPSGASVFDGSVTVQNGKLADDIITPSLEVLDLPSPFYAHGQQLQTAIRRAASDFSTTVDVLASYEDDTISVSSRTDILLKAASGVVATASPFAGLNLLNAEGNKIAAQGTFKLEGGGGPELLLRADRILYEPERGIEAHISGAELKRWTVADRSVGLQIEEAEISDHSGPQAVARGSIAVSGQFPGIALKRTSLNGGLMIKSVDEELQADVLGNGCIEFSSKGARAESLVFEALDLDICPENRVLIAGSRNASSSRVPLGDIAVDFATEETSGTFRLKRAFAQLGNASGFRLDLTGNGLDVPLNTGSNTLTISSEAPAVFFSAGQGPFRFGASLARARFEGSLLPFAVDAQSFDLNARAPAAGIKGTVETSSVRLTDPNPDPLFNPLVTDLSGTLDDLVLTLEGDVYADGVSAPLARTLTQLDLSSLAGQVELDTYPLVFRTGGFQPTDISERLRGILTDATGALSGSATVDIDGGQMSGTGFVEVSDLSFKTFNFGTISGVNSRIEFSDLLGLRTPSEQRLRIGEMNVGLPLLDGVVSFQLHGPTEASLQDARWPLAGGVLSVRPMDWRLGAASQKVTVAAEGVELEELLAVLAVPKLKATGTVSGTFPVDIEGANIFVRDARFVADPPGGTLAYSGEETDAVAEGNQYAEIAFDALKRLDYSVMELGANGNLIGDLLVTAVIIGSNPDVLNGADFKYNISIDSRLAELLTSLRGSPLETYAGEAYELITEDEGGR
ncbi:MAG: YdbH domain-containing protein [Pseudomonadota bacterium]